MQETRRTRNEQRSKRDELADAVVVLTVIVARPFAAV